MRAGPPRLIAAQMFLDATTFLMPLWQTLLIQPLWPVWKMFQEQCDDFVCLKIQSQNKIHMLFLLSSIDEHRVIYMSSWGRVHMNVGWDLETLSGDASVAMNRTLVLWLQTTTTECLWRNGHIFWVNTQGDANEWGLSGCETQDIWEHRWFDFVREWQDTWIYTVL